MVTAGTATDKATVLMDMGTAMATVMATGMRAGMVTGMGTVMADGAVSAGFAHPSDGFGSAIKPSKGHRPKPTPC